MIDDAELAVAIAQRPHWQLDDQDPGALHRIGHRGRHRGALHTVAHRGRRVAWAERRNLT